MGIPQEASILLLEKRASHLGFSVHSRELSESTALCKYIFAVGIGSLGQARLGDGRISLD